MLRLILGIVAGVVLAGVLVGVFETLGHALYPPPAGIDLTDPAQLAAVMERIPLAAKLWVVGAWGLAAYIAGLVAAMVSKRTWTPWIIAGVVAAAAVTTVLMIVHPTWMNVAAVAAPALAGWLAVLTARRIIAQ
ncbi:hypothetical protein [Brevundimonas sp. Root1279]|uniref:hypothetical protein n=1 Tax=Brevundimonas sp. Root1279 TaxID=1736443 RepID=UPI0006F308DC|nr:hypothetical protein [Brevundimonas sp. Root1279]KQW82940.1 hypothetical protein ASC65_06230 [Brevundimonas sp. Root1279]